MPTGKSDQPATIQDVKNAADEVLARLSGPELTASGLFPFGITQIAISVKAGDAEINVQIAGPDHAHGDEGEWFEEEMGDLFDEDDDEL
ncbi:MAG: hypothetical protein ACK47B_07280 [Armatimonadota bacterium]